ncbi:MAG TPA: ABC transporter permease [Longimicrobiales bacterium]
MLPGSIPKAKAVPIRRGSRPMYSFRDIERVKAECRRIGHQRERDMRRAEVLSELRQDVLYALRQLRAAPAFALVAVLTLALGIGATSTIFSAVRAVLLRPFPFGDPERVMLLSEVWQGRSSNISAGNFVDYREQARVFEHLAAVQYASFNLTEDDLPERVVGARVSHGFFDVFGARPMLGRVFLPEEDVPGKERVVVLSHRLWQRRFGSDAGIVGRQILMNGVGYTVVGIMPAAFDYMSDTEDLWVPLALTPQQLAARDEHGLEAYGLLAPGVTPERARAEVELIAARLVERFPQENGGRTARVEPFVELLVQNYRQRLLILQGAVGLVLLIACANVAGLLLARGTARRPELAVRSALGARRGRIVRQLLTESAVLGLAGGAAGLLFAYWGVRALVAGSPPGVPRLEQASIDPAVLGFTLAAALASSLVFGLVPALRAARPDLHEALKEGGRSGAGAVRDRVRSVLVAAEIALALTLLAGAGLLIRTSLHLQRVDPGFEPAGVLTARLTLPAARYGAPAVAARAFDRVLDELRRAPGVESAAVGSTAPLGPCCSSNGLVPEGRPLSIESVINAYSRFVTPDYFETLGIPLLRGRLFTDRDTRQAPLVMIVNEELARQAWPGEDPIGKRIVCCEGTPEDPVWKTVVGVVANTRARGPGEDVRPEFYLPLAQVPPDAWEWTDRSMTIVARKSGDPAALAPAFRAAVRAVDPSLPLYRIEPLAQSLRASVAQTRFNTLLLTALGLAGLLLAAVGIYGVIAYFVGQRAREFGVRMALGATARDIVLHAARHGLVPVTAGVALGLAGALAAARALRSSVRGITTTDPVTFAAVVAVMIAAALVAIVLPARRAARRVDTAAVLRES